MTACNFGPAAAGEETVFGACRPAHPREAPDTDVDDWIAFVRGQGIERVCCLLDDELDEYDDLLGAYREAFGAERVRHAPIDDVHAVDPAMFRETVLPFLEAADDAGEPVVVHCSGGGGRTGHVLAAWLVAGRGYDLDDAIDAVVATGRVAEERLERETLERLLAG